MDTRATKLSDADAQKLMMRRLMAADVHTSMPGQVVSFDSSTQTASIRLATRRVVTIDGQQSTPEYPILENVPLVMPYSTGSGFALTVPVQSGDSVLVHFGERSIDGWHEGQGNVTPVEPVAPRHHDLSDGLFTLGAIPVPNAISGYRQDGVEIRNGSGNVRATVKEDSVELVASNVTVTINSDGTVTMNAPTGITTTTPTLTQNGDLVVNGGVSWSGSASSIGGGPALFSGGIQNTDGDVVSDGISLETHTHSGVTTGGDNTGGPN